jgi:hypothetical protein
VDEFFSGRKNSEHKSPGLLKNLKPENLIDIFTFQ